MVPLAITARLRGAVALPNGPLHLDGLLAWAVATRDMLPPALTAGECRPIAIPVERSSCGRVYLATAGHYEVECHEHRFINRRFPLAEAQMFGDAKLRRVNISAGAQKSYRLPLDTIHVVDDTIRFWCIGEREEIESLLSIVGYLGKKRGVGLGAVAGWTVEPCEPWEGFPVVRDGQPLRYLPTDWPGLRGHLELGHRVLSAPYWDHSREELVALPQVSP